MLLPILLYLLTETPSAAAAIADPRLLSLHIVTIIFVFQRSRPLVVLVERVKILDVRLPVLFEITQNGELARGRVLCRWCGRSCQRRVVLVVVYEKKKKKAEEERCERGRLQLF